jgi:hypothetical protein
MFLGPPHNHEGHHCQSIEYPNEEAAKVNQWFDVTRNDEQERQESLNSKNDDINVQIQ